MINQQFLADAVAPAELDLLWANGWRHFGTYFFRYSHAWQRVHWATVLPLRIVLEEFTQSASQRRIWRKNQDLQVTIRATTIDAAKETLFARHRERFTDNIPDSLSSFLSPEPATVPCRNEEICVFEGERLLAASFLDLGEQATSAVYAMFAPEAAARSLGIFTMLLAIQYSQQKGCRYYYPGYAYREPSIYDYKKKFSALEYFNWQTGWQTLPRALTVSPSTSSRSISTIKE